MEEISTPAPIGLKGERDRTLPMPCQRTVDSSMAINDGIPVVASHAPPLSAAAPSEPLRPSKLTAPMLAAAAVTCQHPASRLPPLAELAEGARGRARTNLRGAGSGCSSKEIY